MELATCFDCGEPIRCVRGEHADEYSQDIRVVCGCEGKEAHLCCDPEHWEYAPADYEPAAE